MEIQRLLNNELRQVLEYNPRTGEFFWLVSKGNSRVGEAAGSIYANGYRYIQIDGLDYRAGRLAWFFVTGEDPVDFVDHKDGVKDNNRFCNLRKATNSQNQANRGLPSNNSSGFKGVSWQPSRCKWIAKITIGGKSINLGRYTNIDDAVRAYKVAAQAAWGEFAQVPSDEEIAALASRREKI